MFRYFALIVDLFSRYVEIIPLQDQTAESITQAFKVGWVFRGHGIPEVLLTDQGKNVDGHEVREMCKKLGIHKRHSSPYHPQGDGMAERDIGTAKQLICSLLMERKIEKGAWVSVLPEVSFLMNNARNTTTKVSPHMITFGRQPRAPTDVTSTNAGTEGSTQDYWESLQDVQNELPKTMLSNEDKTFAETKKRYDRGKRLTNIKPGSYWKQEKERIRCQLNSKAHTKYGAREEQTS